MTNCEPCGLREAGDTDGANRIEALRCQRLALTVMSGASIDAAEAIAAEYVGCFECVSRLAVMYLSSYTQAFSRLVGGYEAAAALVEQALMRDLDAQP